MQCPELCAYVYCSVVFCPRQRKCLGLPMFVSYGYIEESQAASALFPGTSQRQFPQHVQISALHSVYLICIRTSLCKP